jgi:mannitol-1-/sugar-/sorbitol-6-phosphatase
VSGLVTVDFAGILFDMDGVLVSSIGSVNRSWRKWAEHYGLPNPETFQIEHGTRAVDTIAKLRPDLEVAEGLQLIEDLEMEDVADLKVLPGARALLESLPPERWAIVTSATNRLLLGRLKAAELPVPERFISGDMVKRGKPDPEPYRRGAELIHSAPTDCLVVEDAPSGVGAGIAAGCRVLGVLGTHSEAELRAAGASWIVQTLEDVSARTGPKGLTLSLKAL